MDKQTRYDTLYKELQRVAKDQEITSYSDLAPLVGAKGYFSQLKRSIDGTHHRVSAHHLHRYLGEFDHRYNTRKITDSERTQTAIQMTTGKQLMYQQPIEHPEQ